MKMSPYSTHQALLVAALAATKGDILEIGAGWYSTPLVSSFSVMQKRCAYTVETGEFVHALLRPLATERHAILLMDGYNFDRIGKFKPDPGRDRRKYVDRQREFLEELWTRSRREHADTAEFYRLSVVFIDQAPGFLRVPAIEFFADKADFIITHDTEHVGHYHYEPTMSSFKYRWDFRLHKPNSVILSNYRDCSCFGFLDPDSGPVG
jgi:hypothetical protein